MKSIKTRIIVMIVLLIAVMGGVGATVLGLYISNYKELQRADVVGELNGEASNINQQVALFEQAGLDLAGVGELLYASTNRAALSAETAVNAFFEDFTPAAGGGIWFEPSVFNARVCYYSLRAEDGSVSIDPSFAGAEYDYPNQTWYTHIKGNLREDNKVIWTRPYIDETGTMQLMTTIGSGMYYGGEFIGMSTVDWVIDDIVAQVTGKSLRPTENSFVLFADLTNDSIVCYTADETMVGKSLASLNWLDKITLGEKSALLPSETKASYEIDGTRRRYLTYSKVLLNNMALITAVPQSEMYADVNGTIAAIIVIFILLVVAAVVITFFFINGKVIAPIKILNAKATEIGGGNFDVKIDLRSGDELQTLADTFNKMTTDLKSYMEKLRDETERRMLIGAELSVATQIQSSMLPCIFPAFPERHEIDIYAHMEPAKEVGGDFYDFFLVDDDHLAMVMADVSGKGVPAALFMVIAKTLIKNQAQNNHTPAKIFEIVNNQLCENNDANMFVTAFIAILEISTGKVRYANAGHNPVAVRKKDGRYEYMNAAVDFILAGMTGIKYTEGETTLEEGDKLVMYTDGVTEALDERLELYGEERFLDCLNSVSECDTKDTVNAVYDDIRSFAGAAEQADDITILAVKYNGMPTMNTFECDATVENLAAVLDFIESELSAKDCDDALKMQIAVVAEELYVNIASYAYENGGKVTVNMSVDEDIIIEFADCGKKYNPLEKEDPDLSLSAEDRPVGGLGIYMVKNMVDNVYYRYADNKNILTIKKIKPEGNNEEND